MTPTDAAPVLTRESTPGTAEYMARVIRKVLGKFNDDNESLTALVARLVDAADGRTECVGVGEPPEIRRVVCSAARYGNMVIAGVRHFDPVMGNVAGAIDPANLFDWEQGFLDNRSEFLSRNDALVVAVAANQVVKKHGRADELYSEDFIPGYIPRPAAPSVPTAQPLDELTADAQAQGFYDPPAPSGEGHRVVMGRIREEFEAVASLGGRADIGSAMMLVESLLASPPPPSEEVGKLLERAHETLVNTIARAIFYSAPSMVQAEQQARSIVESAHIRSTRDGAK